MFQPVMLNFWRLFGGGLCLPFVLACGAAEPEKSVIQIFIFNQQPFYDSPWRFNQVGRGTGSGFVVKGKRIMTNAHVVSWARQILVRRYQDPRPYLAQVKFIAHDCDLALLEVEDAAFFEGLEPLAFGTLPTVRSTVTTYGFPAGGEQISYTKGVVSRIEVQTYSHIGNRSFLAAQTDAAINPGNSGGPVIQEDLVVGVAFQGIAGLENTGFFIPPPIIEHFLEDIADGVYNGFPAAGVRVTSLHNPAFRKALKMSTTDQGCRVDSIMPQTSSFKLLKENDVLLKIGPYEVGSDMTILYQGNRVHLAAAFQTVQSGGQIPLKIWREGQAVEFSLPLQTYEGDRATGNQYDKLPRYYVHGGLVFTPLSMDYLKTFGRNWSDSVSAELIYELFYRRHETPATARPEPIVMAQVLADPVNANFNLNGRNMVDKINGKRIEKLEDVIQAFESGTNAQHTLEFLPRDGLECLDRQQAEAANERILQTYGIVNDRRL